MARRSRQSFLKRQRERDRQEKAALKRKKRMERRQKQVEGDESVDGDDSIEDDDDGPDRQPEMPAEAGETAAEDPRHRDAEQETDDSEASETEEPIRSLGAEGGGRR